MVTEAIIRKINFIRNTFLFPARIKGMAILVLLLFMGNMPEEPEPDKQVALKFDDCKITVKELSERLNFIPASGEFNSAMDRKLDLVASIIVEKIFADEAKNKNLDTLLNFKLTVKQYEKEAVYEEWMNKEITGKISVSGEDLSKAYKRFVEQRVVDYLVFNSENNAKDALKEIKSGKDINSFMIDGKPLVQTKEIEFSESLQRLEDIIYSLKVNQTTDIIPIDNQYYIFKLKKMLPHPKYSTQNLNYWKLAVEKRIKARKTESSFAKLMPVLMKNRTFTVNKKVYNFVLSALAKKLNLGSTKTILPETAKQELAKIPEDIQTSLNEPFMKFETGEVWTVGDIWQKLRFGPYLLNYQSEKDFNEDFAHLLRTVVIFETVMSNGYKKGYDKSDYVREQVRMWEDDLLSKLYQYDVSKTIEDGKEKLLTQLQQVIKQSIGKHTISIHKDALEKVMLIEGNMLVRKSHFPNRHVVPLPIYINHEAGWFQELWEKQ